MPRSTSGICARLRCRARPAFGLHFVKTSQNPPIFRNHNYAQFKPYLHIYTNCITTPVHLRIRRSSTPTAGVLIHTRHTLHTLLFIHLHSSCSHTPPASICGRQLRYIPLQSAELQTLMPFCKGRLPKYRCLLPKSIFICQK